VIYFLQAGDDGLVKIGRSRSAPGRTQQIQSWEPTKLRLIRSIDAPDWMETWLHQRFGDHRSHGEWFRFHPDMLTVIPPAEKPKPEPKTLPIPKWRRGGTMSWTIKKFPVELRKRAVRAVKAAGLTMAQWIELAIDYQAALDDARRR
jgi:hypothetical protein